MAGGPSTPELTAAVAGAGGYGFVAGGYLSADGLRKAISATRALTDDPFGVDLFVPSAPGDPAEVARYAQELEPDADRLGVELGDPRWEDDHYEAKIGVVESARIHLVSFTFGCPSAETVDRLRRAGCLVAVTVTSRPEAEAAAGRRHRRARRAGHRSRRSSGRLPRPRARHPAVAVAPVGDPSDHRSPAHRERRHHVRHRCRGRTRGRRDGRADRHGTAVLTGGRHVARVPARTPRRALQRHRLDPRLQRSLRPRPGQRVRPRS